MTHYHPKLDEKGNKVAILHPSTTSKLNCWSDPAEAATVVPGGPMPAELNGVVFQPWQAPTTDEEWAAVEGQATIEEPPFVVPLGKLAAAGCVIEEPDGRFWLVSPTNKFGGYSSTFPKGRPEAGASLQACAIRECFEEAGLKVEITGHLADLERSTTYARYFTARRVSGSPADMDWESQAVHLVPRLKLAQFLTNKNDMPLLDALASRLTSTTPDAILRTGSLMSGVRLLSTLDAYRQKFGKWPSKVSIHGPTVEGLTRDVFTPFGWSMISTKLKIAPIEKGTVIAEGEDGTLFDYEDVVDRLPPKTNRADVWIWGIPLAD